MVLNDINTPEKVLSLDSLRWLGNTETNRSNFIKYSVDELKNLQTEAITKWEFEIAAFIRDVLTDKSQFSEIPTDSVEQKIEEKTENTQKQLVDTMSSNITDKKDSFNENIVENDDSLVHTDWEYVQLWEKQQSTAKEIEEYFEQNKITEDGWIKKYVTPQSVEFDWDLIKINHLRDNHFFKRENWQIKEIPLIPDKIYGDSAIRSVYKVWDYYRVELCFLNKYWRVKDNAIFNYIIDKDGNYIPELWQQTWKEKIYLNGFWCYVYDKESTDNKQILRCVYNSKMEKIAEFVDEKDTEYQKYRIQYCGDNFCICYKAIRSANPEYIIFDKTGVVWEWTKSDLQWNEYMQKYKKIEEEKEINAQKFREERARVNAIPFEERFIDKNHCKIVYNDEAKTDISILNDKWDTLYQLKDLKTISYNNDIPCFHTQEWDSVVLEDWKSENNILFVQVKNYGKNTTKSIFINKTTWEKKEFEWLRWEYSFREGKLIKVFYDADKAEVFDDDLNYLWIYDSDQSRIWFPSVKREENWDTKYYIVSEKTGEIVTEYMRHPIGSNWRPQPSPYFNSYEKDWKKYFIVFIPGKGVSQVEL